MAFSQLHKHRLLRGSILIFSVILLVIFLWAALSIHRLNVDDQKLERLGARLRSQRGGYYYQLTPFGGFLWNNLSALGFKKIPFLRLFSKRHIQVPAGFQFTTEEEILLKRTNAEKDIEPSEW